MKNPITQFIEGAIEGGWKLPYLSKYYEDNCDNGYSVFLDPNAWRAYGKYAGWGDSDKLIDIRAKEEYLNFLDLLWQDKTTEEALSAILNEK